MADLLSIALSFPPKKVPSSPQDYDKQITSYIKELGRIPSAQWTQTSNKKSLLEQLDPAVNSVAYMICLVEHLKVVGGDSKKSEELFDRAIIFLASFDAVQVRFAGQMWRNIFEWSCEQIHTSDLTEISPLSTAILRLDPSSGTLTSNHIRFLRLCLAKGVPSAALTIIDKDIYAFPQTSSKGFQEDFLSEHHELSNAYITSKSGLSQRLTAEVVLEYFLLASHVYIAKQNYSRARLFLESVLLTPTLQHATSALQVEAYKKWLLVGLLSEGKRFSYPATVDQSVMKAVKSTSKAYEALADSFERRDWRKLHAELEVGIEFWVEDGNLRLANEVASALPRYRIIDLQRTYAALPVSRVASLLSIPTDDALSLLTQIIRQGHLKASITPAASGASADAVLRFHYGVTSSSATSQEIQLQAQTRRIEDLVTSVRDADRRLQLTKEWIDVQKRAKRTGPDAELADQMDLTWDAPGGSVGILDDNEGDEDIMA